jgi:hypothetical protein
MSNLVETCMCCEERFTYIEFGLFAEKYKEQLFEYIDAKIKHLKLKGSFTLVCTKDYVFAWKYQYKNKKEEKLSDILWDDIYEATKEFAASLIDFDNVDYYSKKAAK